MAKKTYYRAENDPKAKSTEYILRVYHILNLQIILLELKQGKLSP